MNLRHFVCIVVLQAYAYVGESNKVVYSALAFPSFRIDLAKLFLQNLPTISIS